MDTSSARQNAQDGTGFLGVTNNWLFSFQGHNGQITHHVYVLSGMQRAA